MKKTSKLFGAVACSAALALGCAVPAFASSGDSNPQASVDTGTFEMKDGATTGKTDVDVLYKVDQINASLPIQVTIVASGDVMNADNIMAPDPSKYKIINNSKTVGIKVTKVQAANGTDTDNNWALENNVTPPANEAGAASKGKLLLTLDNANPKAGVTPTTVNLNGDTLDTGATITAGWEASKSTDVTSDDTKESIQLKLAGQSLPGKKNTEGAAGVKTTTNAFSITYTLAANRTA